MANNLKYSIEEETDDGQTWIDFDCLEEHGQLFDEWWVKLSDQGKTNEVASLTARNEHLPNDEAKEGLLVSGTGQSHYSVKPLTPRFCSFILQKLKRYSLRLMKQNKRQDKEPLLRSF